MIANLLLGLRLAVGGGRMSGQALLRLAMTAVGIGLVVAVLLPAASVSSVVDAREDRAADTAQITDPKPGVDPLYTVEWSAIRGNQFVRLTSVAAGGPHAPVPPGLTAVPKPGQLFVSPELGRLLAGPDGAGLRSRMPAAPAGTITKPGLVDAGQVTAWYGSTVDDVKSSPDVKSVYGFGGGEPPRVAIAATLLTAVLPVVVALLLPLLIFVTTASRMGAAQRDQRLAALRLLGVDARQVRWVAAGESLLGAIIGLVLGVGLFLVIRPTLGSLDLFGYRVFGEDFVPPWPLAVLVVVLVPALAVGAALFGLRRTIVEPLGVVRQGKPVRRRMWWRWGITAVGVLLVGSAYATEAGRASDVLMFALTAGSALLLIGVTVLLPWIVEGIAGRLRGGPPAWQLAVRRLQLDSGTPSRVVSGLVVVVAGSILLQVVLNSLLAADAAETKADQSWAGAAHVTVYADQSAAAEVQQRVAAAPGLTQVGTTRRASAVAGDQWTGLEIGSCAALALRAQLPSCVDGSVFAVGDAPVPSGPVHLTADSTENGPLWTPPANVVRIPLTSAARNLDGTLLVTDAAVAGVPVPGDTTRVYAKGPGGTAEVGDRVAAAISSLTWHATVDTDERSGAPTGILATIRSVLLAASLFVLAVAALSLLMLAVEQIAERRRALAALAASGVPLGVLARSSFAQIALPVAIGVVLAVLAGTGLTLPILRAADIPLKLDVGLIASMAGAAVAAVLVVTACTIPLLRQVTKVESLRAE
ncbi:FtsX-like permease family protein [Amycolatopsis rhabdoformis]|uniref:FtsX-like permease family protein n=1 Tax=Amycolatopsis rhabdoformis TaxID=1448059 RepID=A0ABZ1I0L6_9PSEU|nr:FtsX-like permease family protein [Amycolatopsis rhabdoformis]WSE27128.1 FtsX-like permease family protein [Amycolatopsis rhabdoformis]